METFGEKLKTLRMMHNLSQRELGQRMGGIKQQTIAQYEKKEKAPKLETVLKIADALGINPNVFYDDLSHINDVFYWYAEDEDLYFFGTNEKVFALKPKSIQAIQKAIEGFITPIVEQLKIIEPLYELLVRRFGNIKNFIENLKEDSTLLGEFCKEMSVSLCMDVDDVEQRVLIYLQIYCEEKRMSVKVITTQGEELIINPEV